MKTQTKRRLLYGAAVNTMQARSSIRYHCYINRPYTLINRPLPDTATCTVRAASHYE